MASSLVALTDLYSEYPLLQAKTQSQDLLSEEYSVGVEDVQCHAAVWNFSDNNCISVVLDRVSNLDFISSAI